MEYKSIFINPQKGAKESGQDVAARFDKLLKQHADEGWKFVRIESLKTFVPADAGCLGLGLIGAQPAYSMELQVVIFVK